MKISTSITGIDYQHLVDHLKTLESAGFSSVSTQENRLNPFLPLSIAAAGSQALELKTSVAIAFARSPMVTAQIAWELARASEGSICFRPREPGQKSHRAPFLSALVRPGDSDARGHSGHQSHLA